MRFESVSGNQILVANCCIIFQTVGYTAGAVVIKVDSGMSRNGCQPEDLPAIMEVGYTPKSLHVDSFHCI